ncbi:hypothetical protein lerEdw1_012918 [Lerista edwardsae]|nr:hypothetical protein lerEdw1_012918 [Lerista edwardsae]
MPVAMDALPPPRSLTGVPIAMDNVPRGVALVHMFAHMTVSGTMAEAEEKEPRSNEESTDESEEEESEEEPKLKYERLSNGVTEILQKDVASCMTVHEKFLALGTHYGKVYLLDVQGNITQKFDISPVKINQISLDESGEHMGVCSEDGKVQVFGLYTGEEFHETFDCPIKIVAVHPQFVRSHCKQFVTGGNKLLLYERTWMNRWKPSVLHEGEGNLRSVKWRGNLIAWANNMGVKILDVIAKQRITNVPRDDISLRPDMYPCSLCWKDNLTLIIGWGNSVKICSVKERHASEMRDLPSRYVEIVSQFNTEFYISGVAPLCDQLVILSYVKEISEKTAAQPRTPRSYLWRTANKGSKALRCHRARQPGGSVASIPAILAAQEPDDNNDAFPPHRAGTAKTCKPKKRKPGLQRTLPPNRAQGSADGVPVKPPKRKKLGTSRSIFPIQQLPSARNQASAGATQPIRGLESSLRPSPAMAEESALPSTTQPIEPEAPSTPQIPTTGPSPADWAATMPQMSNLAAAIVAIQQSLAAPPQLPRVTAYRHPLRVPLKGSLNNGHKAPKFSIWTTATDSDSILPRSKKRRLVAVL